MGATAGDGQGLQGRVDAIFGTADARGTSAEVPFSPFIRADVAKSGELSDALAEALERDGVAGAVAQAERFVADPDAPTGAVKHALKTFITHTPAVAAELRLPTAVARRTVPARDTHRELATGHPSLPAPNPLTQPPAERALDWYRQDPFANDHHGHWHDVYPTDGVRLPDGTRRTQPRQGELFLYMHQQMLARYDTERAIAGLRPVVPFRPPYDEPIPEGYGLTGYVTRPPGDRLRGIPRRLPLDQLRGAHQQLEAAAASGRLTADDGRELALDESLLGAATEQSSYFPDDDADEVPLMRGIRNLHGNGHVLAAIVEPDPRPQEQQWFGAILHVETAICDPFFYRWHRHIDDLGADFQKTQPPNDFSVHAAEVRLRGEADLALCLTNGIPGADAADFDFAAWGRATLGDDLAGQHPARTDQLRTRFVESEIVLPHTNRFWTRHGLLRDVVHLEHEPFTAFLRVENPRASVQDVTVRLFLCHAEHVEERRMWIELDKFRATLAPGVNVVAQPDARSSVIKRRGLEAPGAVGPADSWDEVAYCDCGWPYTLLLPSGASNAAGTEFVLMAALTDWDWDRANDEARTCGSMSFCGAQDKYPDLQAMGYPFNRPFAGGLVSAIDAAPSMTRRDLTIRCENPAPGRA